MHLTKLQHYCIIAIFGTYVHTKSSIYTIDVNAVLTLKTRNLTCNGHSQVAPSKAVIPPLSKVHLTIVLDNLISRNSLLLFPEEASQFFAKMIVAFCTGSSTPYCHVVIM